VARLLVSIKDIDAGPGELRLVPSVRVRPATRRARRSRRRGSREPRWCLPGWRVTGPPDVPEDPTVECAGRSTGTGRGHRERSRRCRSRGRRAAVPRQIGRSSPATACPAESVFEGGLRPPDVGNRPPAAAPVGGAVCAASQTRSERSAAVGQDPRSAARPNDTGSMSQSTRAPDTLARAVRGSPQGGRRDRISLAVALPDGVTWPPAQFCAPARGDGRSGCPTDCM
jgi:hypothetical protein